MSLTSCRLWDNTADHKGCITHKLMSWDSLSDLWFKVTYPLKPRTSDHATKNMVTTNLYFIQLFIGHLKHDQSYCPSVQSMEYLPPDEWFSSIYHSIWSTYLLMNGFQVFIIPYGGHLPPCPPITINVSYAHVQFDKNAYPEMWKLWKNYDNSIIPFTKFMPQNMSDQCQC